MKESARISKALTGATVSLLTPCLHKRAWMSLLLVFMQLTVFAQYAWQENEERSKSRPQLTKDIDYSLEFQGTFSKGKTPLWLNANKHGLSSLKECNGYTRAGIFRPLSADSIRRWGIGYGADMAVAAGFTSEVVVQQAFVEARWLHGVLTIGAKEYPMELKNPWLSSGSQTLGINARPVPQARLALPKYWTLPFGNGWIHLKGHIAVGKMTDDSWQHEFTQKKSRYADDVMYHSKAGYLKFGNDYAEFPLSVELGLEMAAQYGGKPYIIGKDGNMTKVETKGGLKGLWNVFIPGGSDATDGLYHNKSGNHLGSYVFRINYNTEYWMASLYGDHFFEDHSQMFLIDYNGYGSGEDWNKWVKNRYFMYALKDIMLGAEFRLHYGRWLKDVLVEYLHTTYQSGPYNHDRTQNISDHIAGTDDYYNHYIYTGWQHWGQVIGNPLYRSPIYNNDGKIDVKNNRFIAWHLGVRGEPTDNLAYRLLATYQKAWGTYENPFTRPHHNASFLLEATYRLNRWSLTGAYAMDFSSDKLYGHNAGLQLTLRRCLSK